MPAFAPAPLQKPFEQPKKPNMFFELEPDDPPVPNNKQNNDMKLTNDQIY